MAESRNITMKDVAREAGVALGTVSRVINGMPVGKSYQARVEKAIDKLGYRVNRLLRDGSPGPADPPNPESNGAAGSAGRSDHRLRRRETIW